MTVEELIQQANNGNADAAFAIAQALAKDGNLEDFEKALPWYEKAALAGSVPGLEISMSIRKVKAQTAKEKGDWDEMGNQALRMIVLCGELFENEKLADKMFTVADKFYRHACYTLAFAQYICEKHEQALDTLKSLEGLEDATSPLVKILKGLCMMAEVTERNCLDGLSKIQQLLLPLETSPEQLAKAATDKWDEYLLMKGFLYLALMLRMPPNNDIQCAYNVLYKGSQLLSSPGKENLEKELTHYRRTFFGGLQYV